MRKTWGMGDGAKWGTGRTGSIAKVRIEELGWGQQGRTTPAGGGRQPARAIVIGVSCSGSGARRGRTELELGSRKSLEDHHGAATFRTAPKRARFLGGRCLLFYPRLRDRAEQLKAKRQESGAAAIGKAESRQRKVTWSSTKETSRWLEIATR